MTFAWYGHLKFKDKPIFLVIITSWGIAFFEYLLQVPANRWGSNVYTPAQLKIIRSGQLDVLSHGSSIRFEGLILIDAVLAESPFAQSLLRRFLGPHSWDLTATSSCGHSPLSSLLACRGEIAETIDRDD